MSRWQSVQCESEYWNGSVQAPRYKDGSKSYWRTETHAILTVITVDNSDYS